MKKYLLLCVVLFILIACSNENDQNNSSVTTLNKIQTKGSSHSFAFPSFIWNNHVYRITTDKISSIDKEIGEILQFTTNESDGSTDNSSNYFPKGTKIYSIVNIDTSIAVAVKSGDNEYVKAYLFNNEKSQKSQLPK